MTRLIKLLAAVTLLCLVTLCCAGCIDTTNLSTKVVGYKVLTPLGGGYVVAEDGSVSREISAYCLKSVNPGDRLSANWQAAESPCK